MRSGHAGHLDAAAYQAAKPGLLTVVLDALADLRARYDVVILEGAGSPTEINLLDGDIVNLRLAARAGVPAVVVGDIDRGGVFAALYGTVALLPDDLRRHVRGFVVNKFRGDPVLLGDGLAELERRSGVPTLGVLPYVSGLALDAEDSLALRGVRPASRGRGPTGGAVLDVAAIQFPRIANFTDLDALAVEPGVHLRLVEHATSLGDPDLVILPGTKATVADLDWLRGRGLDRAVASARDRGSVVLGICGGYQMLGHTIVDGVESARDRVAGLGWLDVDTVFGPDKVTRQRRGFASSTGPAGTAVAGYQIHHGRVTRGEEAAPWLRLDDSYGTEDEGAARRDGAPVMGTSLHGLFDADGFRGAFLAEVGRRRGRAFAPGDASFAAARDAQVDRLADLLEANLDLAAVDALVKEAGG